MKVILNGKEVDRLREDHRKDLERGAPRELVTGYVLSAKKATANARRAANIVFTVFSAFALVVLGGLIVSALSGGALVEMMIIIPLTVLLLVFIALIVKGGHSRTARRWAERLPERIAALPASGTDVRLDTDGVTVGMLSARWSALRIDQLEYIAIGDSGSEVVKAERVTLVGARKPMTLDKDLITNGGLMITTACRRLLSKEP